MPHLAKVYCAKTEPAESVSASVLPKASTKKFAVPAESVRVDTHDHFVFGPTMGTTKGSYL